MSTYVAHVVYDAAFANLNRWMLDRDEATVRVRFREASGPEVVHDLDIRVTPPRLHADNDWKIGPVKVEGVLGRVEFMLRGAPDHVSDVFRSLRGTR